MRQPRTCCYRFVLLFWLGLSLAGPGVAQAQPAVPTFPVPSTVLRTANLRASPSTTAARIGSAPAGSTLTFAGCNAACDWYETAEGAWIAAFLVEVQAGRAALLPTPTPIAIVQGTPATVTKIVDGDTIEVSIDGSSHRLRYILVNTPETGQPYAAEATAANSALVAGKTVYLVQDVSETDRYDRLLRYVYLADGTFVNAELVRQGFAQVATYPPDVSQEAVIRAAEAEARAAGRGLWATGAASFGPAGAATTGAANLRAGPGTDYPVVRTAPAGTALALTGRDASGEWLQTAEGLWVFAALVEGAPTSLGVVGGGGGGGCAAAEWGWGDGAAGGGDASGDRRASGGQCGAERQRKRAGCRRCQQQHQ
jgi:endonuclease YncB( thermonuclease family)